MVELGKRLSKGYIYVKAVLDDILSVIILQFSKFWITLKLYKL